MDIINVIEKNYRYISVGFGGLFLVPQIIHGYKRQSLEDVSTITLLTIGIMSILWTLYMYDMNYILYAYIAGFVFLNSVILISMQILFYYKRFKLHVTTFETKPKPDENIQVIQPPVPIILQMPSIEYQTEKTLPTETEINIENNNKSAI